MAILAGALHPVSTSGFLKKSISSLESPRFGNQNHSDEPQTSVSSKKETRRLWGGEQLAWVTVVLNFVGGLAIVTASLMPLPESKDTQSITEKPSLQFVVESENQEPIKVPLKQLSLLEQKKSLLPPEVNVFFNTIQTSLQDELNPQKLAELQPEVNKMGWLLFSMAMFTAAYSWMGVAFNRKQPSILLGNVMLLGTAPLFIFLEPSPALIGLSFIFIGMAYSGVGNILDEEHLEKGEKGQGKTLDFSDLLYSETYQGLVQSPEKRREFLQRRKAMIRFILNDQKEVLKAVNEVTSELKRNQKDLVHYFKIKIGQAIPAFSPKEEGAQNNEKPRVSATKEQAQVSSLLYYIGGGVMPLFPLTGAIIVGLGSLNSNLLNLAIGTQRDDKTGKLLEYSSLLRIPIDFFQHIPAVLGANRMLRAVSQDLIAVELNKKNSRLMHIRESNVIADDKEG